MKTLKCFLLLFIAAQSQFSWAEALDSHLSPSRQAFFHQLNSQLMEVIEEGNPYFDEKLGDYPLLAKLIQLDIFKWNPKGKISRSSAECDVDSWLEQSLNSRMPEAEWSERYERFLKNCAPEWETGRQDWVSNGLGMVSLKLHPNRYPYGRHVMFHLPNGIKLKGFLAMKPDAFKRPLVIFRTGIFSNTQEFYPERSLFFQMFEQSPFHVLVIESSSGSEFFQHNSSYAIGGFDEGLQNFYLAQKLQMPREPISRLISDIHMMGLSMGGHGALFTALLNQVNSRSGEKPVLQSALVFCPLLNLHETLDFHRSQGLSMDVMNYYASRRLKILKEKVPGLKDENFIPQLLDWMAQNYRGPLIAENGQIPGVILPKAIENLLQQNPPPQNLFWKLNDFWPWFEKVQTPVQIFSTRQDPIVSWFINSGRIEDQRMRFEDSDLRLWTFEKGYHCSLPVAYDWGSLTSMFQSFLIRKSPNLKLATREKRFPLTEKIARIFKDKPAFVDLEFEVPEASAELQMQVRFYLVRKPSWIERKMAQEMKLQLPLSEMEFPLEERVRNSDEASILQRWAYQNVKAQVQGSELVVSWRASH